VSEQPLPGDRKPACRIYGLPEGAVNEHRAKPDSERAELTSGHCECREKRALSKQAEGNLLAGFTVSRKGL